MKTKALTDMQFLELLEKTLAKVTDDTHLASAIYQEVAKEVRLIKNIQAFEKFCEKGGLPDAEPATLEDFERELTTQFGEQSVEITKDEKGSSLEVAIELPDRVIKTKVKVDPALAEEEPVPAPFVPFPVSLAEDPELVWVLGRREDLGPDEASRALEKIQQEFWETKKGVELQRGGTEKCFAEFIIYVPAAALTDSGLKRHYKGAETLRTLGLQRGV